MRSSPISLKFSLHLLCEWLWHSKITIAIFSLLNDTKRGIYIINFPTLDLFSPFPETKKNIQDSFQKKNILSERKKINIKNILKVILSCQHHKWRQWNFMSTWAAFFIFPFPVSISTEVRMKVYVLYLLL